MEYSILKPVYNHLPVFAQNWACSNYARRKAAIRYGSPFQERLTELIKSDYWSASQIEAYQNEQLQRLIEHAFQYVPYYRDIMRQRKLTPADIRTRNDLYKLPILTKEDVRKNFDRLLAENVDKKQLVLERTSGTTGTPLRFYLMRNTIATQRAVWWRHRIRFGIDFGTPHVNITGRSVVPVNQLKPPYWRWCHSINQAIISRQQIRPEKIPHIVQFLNSSEFEYYSGYPGMFGSLCAMANEQGLNLDNPPRVVFTGGGELAGLSSATHEALYGFSYHRPLGFK